MKSELLYINFSTQTLRENSSTFSLVIYYFLFTDYGRIPVRIPWRIPYVRSASEYPFSPEYPFS